MLTCPRCGWIVAEAHAQVCPNCGLALREASAADQEGAPPPPYVAPPSAPTPPTYGAPPSMPAPPPYGAPPAYGAPPPYGAPPTYGAPPSMPMPPYGAPPTYGAPPSMPAPGGPTYGTGYGAPGGYPGAYAPGQGWRPSAQPEPRPWGRIIGAIFGGLIVVAIVVSVIYNVTRPPAPPVKFTSAQKTQTAVVASTILADPLTSNVNGWSDDSHCYFDTNGYHIRNAWMCYAPIGSQVDGTESVTAKEIAGPVNHGYGLVFRRVSKGNYYQFMITSSGDYAVFKIQNDTLSDLVPYTPSSAIDVGLNAVNTLSVTMSGPVFDCYVNGVKVTETHDSAFPQGLWGLGVYSTDNVVFTDYLARR